MRTKVKILLITALMMITGIVCAQNKKVAIMETKRNDGVTAIQGNIVRGSMESAVSNAPGYEAYDRVAFDVIMEELNFQHSGAVNDSEIRELGQMAGVQYVLVTEASTGQGSFHVIAKLLDIETGNMKTLDKLCKDTPSAIKAACDRLGVQLIGEESNNGDFNSDAITISVRDVSFEMVKVEGGNFTMGCTFEQSGACESNETPNHLVVISKDYYIGKYEVTQGLWEAVMGNNPSNFKDPEKPVESVTWNECQEFCTELSRLTGRNFRLPTEAEWEFAARGGRKTTSAKFSGSSSAANVAWYEANSNGQTHPVGKLQSNELGIYDMSGNVGEWCQDHYDTYSSKTQVDPKGPSSGHYRVIRGGSCGITASYCRVTKRVQYSPNSRSKFYGLRVVLVP